MTEEAGSTAMPMRRALARPGFRRLWGAQTISRWGDTFNSIALVILVFELTGSGVKVAATVGFEIVPVLALGFTAGAVVDRFPRRAVMIAADLGRALVAVMLVLVHDRLVVVYLAAFVLGALGTFFNPAASSVVPSLVEEDELVGANSAIWSAAVISQIVLAPVAGAVVVALGVGPAFTINAVSFVASAALLRRLPVPAHSERVRRRHVDDIREGLAVIRSTRFLAALAGVQGLAALSAGATSALLVVLAERHLDVGAGRFGLLVGAIGVGAALGPMVMQRYVRDVARRRYLFGPYMLRGVVDLVLAAISNFGVALGALVFYGVGTSVGNITYNSVLQRIVPNRLRGRVFSFYDIVWNSARLASIGAGGVAADTFGIAAVYVLGGAILIGAAILGWRGAGPIPRSPLEVR